MHSPWKRFVVSIAVFAAAGIAAHAAEETQTFDSAESAAAAGWQFNEEAQNPDRDCDGCETDLGWKNSDFAGGAAGEGGGALHRSFGLPIGFYADTTIGELNLEMPFMASGKVGLVNLDFDGHAYLGFFDAATVLEDPFDFGGEVAFCIAEPGGGVEPNFRWGHLFTNDDLEVNHSNQEFLEGIPDSEPIDFSLSYDPSEGDGTFSFVMGDEPEVIFELDEFQREIGATFNAFGVFTAIHGSSPDARSMEVFIDDVTYTSLLGLVGDFNGNGELDLPDVNTLSSEIAAATDNSSFDLNEDGSVNFDDLNVWVKDLKNTWFGDANLDGEFNSGDLVEVFTAGRYEIDQDAGWEQGDWDGNLRFGSGDLVAAFTDGGYEIGPPLPANPVPEPAGVASTVLALLAVMARRRRK